MSASEGWTFTSRTVSTSPRPGRVLGICLNGLCLWILTDSHKNTGILVFVDQFSKMVHLIAVPESINASACARVFIDTIFRLHGLPREFVSDRDPRFTSAFWQPVFKTIRTRLKMSTSDYPETDSQTERANRGLEEILRGYVHSFTNWSEFLPMVEFSINNLVHAST